MPLKVGGFGIEVEGGLESDTFRDVVLSAATVFDFDEPPQTFRTNDFAAFMKPNRERGSGLIDLPVKASASARGMSKGSGKVTHDPNFALAVH